MDPRISRRPSWSLPALACVVVACALAAPSARAEEYDAPDPVELTIDYATVAKADELERAGDVDGALALLAEAAAANPDDAMLVAAHGTLLLTRGDVEGARADFERAIAIHSADPSGYAGLCVIAVLDQAPMRIEDHCEAARNRNIADPVYRKIMVTAAMMDTAMSEVSGSMLDTLVVANPYVPALRLMSLEASLRSGNTVLARNDLQMLYQMYRPADGKPPRIIDRIAAYKLADIVGADLPCYLDHARVQIDRAEELTPPASALAHVAECRPEEAEQATGELVQQYNDAALAARTLGDHAAAIEQLRAALVLAPDDVTLWTSLAHVAFEGKDLATAEEALAKLLELSPDDPEIRRNYGIVLHAQGRADEAAAYLDGAAPGQK